MSGTGRGWLCGCGRLNPDDTQFCGSCGAATSTGGAEDGRTDRTGELLDGRFRLQKKLGEGGMGEVYLARDERLERQVAVKLLAPELTANERARQRMHQEGLTLGRIDHVNVVKVFDLFEVPNPSGGQSLAMAMAYVPGGDLANRLAAGPMPWKDACALIARVLSGLSAIHAEGLVHRDIKPGNVLLSADGTPKIADLGVARDMSGRMQTRVGQVLGTSEYMSPEQVKGEAVDERSDLYAVALLLFELIVGESPFAGRSEFDVKVAHANEAPSLLRVDAAGGRSLIPVLVRALCKVKEERYPSAEAMRVALLKSAGISTAEAPFSRPLPAPAPVVATRSNHPRAQRDLFDDGLFGTIGTGLGFLAGWGWRQLGTSTLKRTLVLALVLSLSASFFFLT